MSNFIKKLRNVEEPAKKTFYSGKSNIEDLKSLCDTYAEEYVEKIKNELLNQAKEQKKSYDVSVLFGKNIEHNPIYEARVYFAFTFDCFSPQFKKASLCTSNYDDYGTPGFITHSPDLLIYFIQKISKMLIQEGVTPFYWKTERHSYKKKAIKTSYPTSEQINNINKCYKEISAMAKKNDSRRYTHWNSAIMMSFKVKAR